MTSPVALSVIPVIRGTSNATGEEAGLALKLTGWIEGEGIASGDTAAAVAGSLVMSGGAGWVERCLGDGNGSQVLRDAARGLASDAELSLEDWAREDYLYGHGDKPRRQRRTR